jgi:hypothetical protein
MIIAIDFDGTIVEHNYPDIGRPVIGAIEYIKQFQNLGAKIILWTMRSDNDDGPTLSSAVNYCLSKGIELYGINSNPTQNEWTSSPKAYANIYIDDAAIGCPLRESASYGARPYVDWDIVGPMVIKLLKGNK